MQVSINRLLAGAGAACALALATGCGEQTVSQASYDELRTTNEQIKKSVEELEAEKAKLEKEAKAAEAGKAGEAGEAGEAAGKAVPAEECKPGAKGRPNVETTFNPTVDAPKIDGCSYVDPAASVIGNVELGAEVYVAPDAHIRGDEGQPIVIGKGTNVQDGVTLHALETEEDGKVIAKNLVVVGGKKYALHIGDNVSLAHGAMVHGPASVGHNTFVGMMAFVFKAQVGANVVIEPGAIVLGVKIADNRYVPAGETIKTQKAADALPKITKDYAFKDLNDGVLHVNHQFAEKYRGGGEKTGEAGEKAEAGAEKTGEEAGASALVGATAHATEEAR